MKRPILPSLVIFSLLITCCETIPENNCGEEDIFSSLTDSGIIFISRRTENSADYSLFKMNMDGRGQEKMTDLVVRYQKPVISHFGVNILFVHYSDDNYYELYSIQIDGSNLTLLDRAKRYCGSPGWSNDDSKIIYLRSRNESTDDKDIILFDVGSGDKIILDDTENNISASLSKDNKIAYCKQSDNVNEIFTMDIDGSNKQKILNNGSGPVWSPGGKRIAYTVNICNSPDEFFGSPQIFVACSDGSCSRQLTDSYLPALDIGFRSPGNYYPVWTPDGKKIVYISDADDGTPEIYIMNSDGSKKQRLTDTERRNEHPEISSDGKLIYFVSNRDLEYDADIYVMDINGKNPVPLSKYPREDVLPALRRK